MPHYPAPTTSGAPPTFFSARDSFRDRDRVGPFGECFRSESPWALARHVRVSRLITRCRPVSTERAPICSDVLFDSTSHLIAKDGPPAHPGSDESPPVCSQRRLSTRLPASGDPAKTGAPNAAPASRKARLRSAPLSSSVASLQNAARRRAPLWEPLAWLHDRGGLSADGLGGRGGGHNVSWGRKVPAASTALPDGWWWGRTVAVGRGPNVANVALAPNALPELPAWDLRPSTASFSRRSSSSASSSGTLLRDRLR
ncbi:hypothetical protein T484DRAFT_1860845 [Baffinella frigidus]|nr:hypothetical protein T484DRAFT_1860845 [Cryptophyta sp. CCMP2293]